MGHGAHALASIGGYPQDHARRTAGVSNGLARSRGPSGSIGAHVRSGWTDVTTSRRATVDHITDVNSLPIALASAVTRIIMAGLGVMPRWPSPGRPMGDRNVRVAHAAVRRRARDAVELGWMVESELARRARTEFMDPCTTCSRTGLGRRCLRIWGSSQRPMARKSGFVENWLE